MKTTVLTFIFSVTAAFAFAQQKFETEVAYIVAKQNATFTPKLETILFTGSSSVRLWENVAELYPNKQVINTGFGGSTSFDLLYYTNDLILQYTPSKVFIYEGDNDIAARKRTKKILKNINEICAQIWSKNNATTIVLIAAKPSLLRWKMRRKYQRLNKKFNSMAKNDARLKFMDIWLPMLANNKPDPSIFIADGLHMNTKGYKIWNTYVKENKL